MLGVASHVDALAQQPTNLSLPARFTGTWHREDGDEMVTLSVNPDAIEGDAVVISNSNGLISHGILKGDRIIDTDAVDTNEGKMTVAGAYMVSPDATSLVKLRQLIYPDRTEEEIITYFRVTPPPAMSPQPATPPPLLAAPDDQSSPAKPAATAAPSSPFAGTWRPADDSAKLTISVTGQNAVLKYSTGTRESGGIQAGKVETQSKDGGMKSTDVFEISSNGHTLIRRRTLEAPNGQTAHETLTYSRSD